MMNEKVEILNDEDSVKQFNKKLTGAEYAKKIKDQCTALVSLSREQAETVVSDPNLYLNYLSLQARLGYTVTNTLLVMNQMPTVTKLKDFAKWKEDKVSLKKGSKGIQIIEPKEYTRKDGSIGTSYAPKYVYDISQTNSMEIMTRPSYTANELLQSLTYKTDILPEIVRKDSTLPRDVYYDNESRKIYVREGLSQSDMIKGLMFAYCDVECGSIGYEYEPFLLDSAAYMLSVKYGIELKDTNFANNCTTYFMGLDSIETVDELRKAEKIYDNVVKRMEHGMYVRLQEKPEKHPTRQER